MTRTVDLPDGRRLAFAEYGQPDGLPVIACHGTPGSRLMLKMADEAAKASGFRIIAPDRPGYGLSSRRRNADLIGWADDVGALADEIGIDEFAIFGISGGAPYALACAWAMPRRIHLAAIVSGLAPLDQKEVLESLAPRRAAMMRRARGGAILLQAMLMLGGRSWRYAPLKMMRRLVEFAPAVEHSALAKEETQHAMLASFREAFRSGSAGVTSDLRNFSRPWGFDVGDIQVPTLLWHGHEDRIVPSSMGRYLADHIPSCTATFIENTGHYWIADNVETVLSALEDRLIGVPEVVAGPGFRTITMPEP